uniref:Uncharacterized protein n=2 Tax=Amphimedon queenslandica TaxID=400682 RepID=A0A1X7UJ62_AMPQE
MASRQVARGQSKKTTSGTGSATSQAITNGHLICPTCSEEIVDPVGKKKGHQSIECNGPCHMWLHRQCAGLSRAAFDAAGASNDPFFCPQCVISNQNQEITTLKLKLDEVLNELSALKNEVANLKTEVSQHLVQDDNNPDSIPTDSTMPRTSARPVGNSSRVNMQNRSLPRDRSCNLVIYGIPECPHECLTSWLRKADRVETPKPRTIDALITALREIGENAVADGINEERQRHLTNLPACAYFTLFPANPGVCNLKHKIEKVPELEKIASKLQEKYDFLVFAVRKSLRDHCIDVEDAKALIKKSLKKKALAVSYLLPCIDILEKASDFNSFFEFLRRCDFIGYLNYKLLKALSGLIIGGDEINKLFLEYEKEYAKLLNLDSFQNLIPFFEEKTDESPDAPLGLPCVSFKKPLVRKFSCSYYAILKQLSGSSVPLRDSTNEKEVTSIEQDALAKWLKEGTVNLTVKRVQMLGPPGSGKTCSQLLLLNEDPPEDVTDSTPIACRAVKATRTSIENGHMKRVDAKAFLSRLACDLIESASKLKETLVPTGGCDGTKSKGESSDNIPTGSPETEATESADTTEKVARLADSANDYHSNKVLQDIVEAIPNAEANLNCNWVYIVDSGGQTAFQELLPLFTRAASLNIITIDLSKGVDEKLDLQYRIDGASFPCDSNFSYTNIEFLRGVFSSGANLQLYHSPHSEEDAATPEYFVLGTHSDDAKATQQKIAIFNKEISSLTSGKKGYSIIPAEQNGDIIYPVNTMLKPGPERQEESKNLCDTIFDFDDDTLDDTFDDTIQLPVRWFAFELTLLEKAGNSSVLHMNDVLSIGRSLEMDDGDTKKALEYLHNVTIILYYPQVLPDIVFVDPHPILDILSRLLALTYKIKRKFLRRLTRETPSEPELDKLSKEGIFTESLLDKLKDDQRFSKSDFINLLLHLHIIVETQDGYFIPFALPPFALPPFGSTGSLPKSDIINPLLIVWLNPVTKEVLPVPRGIFPLAVVNLMKLNQPLFQFFPGSQEYLRYRDAMSFRVRVHDEFIGTIHFIKKHRHIEIHFDTNELKYCPLICEAVTEAIRSSNVVINLKPLHKLAFACCDMKDCYCIVTNEAEEKVECTLCPRPALISGRKEYWNWFHVTHKSLTEAPKLARETTPKTLDITDLKDVLTLLRECHFNGDWEGLGIELGLYKHPTLSDIQQSYTRSSTLTECLASWLLRVDGVDQNGGATYVSLANAFETLGQNAIADHIRKIKLPQEETCIIVNDAHHILDITCLRDVHLSLCDLYESKWLDLGDQLGLYAKTLQAIEDDYSDDRRCLRETLVKWLAGADDVLPSWGSLVQALEAIGENNVAENIIKNGSSSKKLPVCTSLMATAMMNTPPHPPSGGGRGGSGRGHGITIDVSPPSPHDYIHSSPQPHSSRDRDYTSGMSPGSGDLPSPFFNHPQLIESPIPEEPGEDHFGDDFTDFPRYDSRDIVYEEPQRQAKIVGERYLKGDLLGVGAYSKVREMLDCVTLCRRAVKIMKQRRLSRILNGEENVRREIKILKKLNHRNVIKLLDVFSDDNKQKLYIVLEYCVGGLQEMLDKAPRNKFPIWQAHKYFVQLIEGLEYLHSCGIVHKDIKPGNLLLTTDDVVKISDFGVAEELDRFSQSDRCCNFQGSPAFQSPEIASGQDNWSGFKADIWASGVTLYHFTTGKFPFEGESVYKLFAVISQCTYTLPPELPPVLQDLIRGMLLKDPDKRLDIEQIRRHTWFISKHSKPLKEELVRFPPYQDSKDRYRGSTVIPYLESFYNYEGVAGLEATGRWDSQDEEALFDTQESSTGIPSATQSLASVSHERSLDTIASRKSRVHSQENVLFPTSKSVDELGVTAIGPIPSPKPPKKRRGSKRRISEQCTHQ